VEFSWSIANPTDLPARPSQRVILLSESEEVSSGTNFSAGTPMKLFPFHGRAQISSTDLFTYDVTKDGKRFIVNRYVKPDRVAPLIVVLNAGVTPEK